MKGRTFLAGALLTILLLASSRQAWSQIALYAGGSPYAVPVRTYRDIPFRTVVRQQYDYSCGSAALATLLKFHYGREVGEAEIFKAMYLAGDQQSIRKVGFSLLDIKRYLESIGFEGDGYRTDLASVAKAGVPVLTVITVGRYRHFVIIKGIENGMVLVGDPALGLRRMSVPDMEAAWNGIIFSIRGHNPIFNAKNEWAPYAPAPLGPELDRSSLLNAGVGLPVLYQVLQSTPLRPDP